MVNVTLKIRIFLIVHYSSIVAENGPKLKSRTYTVLGLEGVFEIFNFLKTVLDYTIND